MTTYKTIHLQIPLRVSFEHASAKRSVGDSILVMATEGDIVGYGEGCPRSYVTGETWETAKLFIKSDHKDIDANPSAYCALELATLDLQGKLENKSIEALLGLPEISGSFQYTAVLGTKDMTAFSAQVEQYKKFGFQDYKIKIFGNLEEDKKRLNLVPTARLDANNLWSNADDAIAFLKQLNNITAIEEPLTHNDYAGMAKISKALNLPIILDESFLRIEQFAELEKFPIPWIINLRISKMGGLRRSLAIATEARRRGIKLVIGAQVGETSILTRSALTIANAFRDIVIAQEGAFGTLLLEHDIVDPPLQFGKGGILDSKTFNFPTTDLGLNIKI